MDSLRIDMGKHNTKSRVRSLLSYMKIVTGDKRISIIKRVKCLLHPQNVTLKYSLKWEETENTVSTTYMQKSNV